MLPLKFAITPRVGSSVLKVRCLVASCVVFAGSLCGLWNPVSAETPVGISATKPAAGPYVEVPGGFMVPYREKIPGSQIEFEMVPVPGGVYKMGSAEDSIGHKADEGPQVEIKVDPMWVAKHEITWAEYKHFMSMYRYFKKFQAQKLRIVNDENRVDAVTVPTPLFEPSFTFEYGEEPEKPAITITQYSAKQYTKWLSKLTTHQYRLPTEAEWEYACRAGTQTPWSWGDDADAMDEYAWTGDNSDAGPSPVGTKKPNAYGLHDMHGNVAEWCVDYYTEDGYKSLAGKSLNAVEAGKFDGPAYPRVVRGGSWEMTAEEVRSAARLGSHDEDWKAEDPNLPLSPWWFTSDPARGVGFRLFRSYQPLADEKISKFWEIDSEDVQGDVDTRISEGRGVFGIVDPELPKAIEAISK